MPDESTGFEPEPFTLAALAGQEQLHERIRELENERAGKVLVDPEDLRLILVGWASVTTTNVADVRAAWDRLYEAAGIAVEWRVGFGTGDRQATQREAVTEALRAGEQQP